MNTLECIRTRKTIRKYTDQPVEFDKLTLMLDAGAQAPSSGNIQNWKFCLIIDKSLIQALYEPCARQGCVSGAQAIIIVVGKPHQADRFYGVRGSRLYTIQNCAAAVENMLLAAHELGLGACWVGAFDEDKVAEIVGISEEGRTQAIITIGYPAEDPKKPARSPLESMTYFNGYGGQAPKLKKAHMYLKDYSIEWERYIKNAEPKIEKGAETIHKHIKHGMKKLKEKIDEHKKKKDEAKKHKDIPKPPNP